MSLLFITSPAKSLDETTNWKEANVNTTLPRHLEKTTTIARHLKALSQQELKKTLSVSDKLAKLNFERMKKWHKNHTIDNAKPAILLYDGDIYKELSKDIQNKVERNYYQQSVRIISGFYGLLRPLDLIQPYRLEMKTKLTLTGDQSLAHYWSEEIMTDLNNDAADCEAIINLASNEYYAAIDEKKLTTPIVKVDFKEKRDGKLKTIAIYAKKARGAMIEYAVKNNINIVEALKKATINGYAFSEDTKNGLLFTR